MVAKGKEQVSVRSVVEEAQSRGATISQTQRAVLEQVLQISPEESERIVKAITTARSAISMHRRVLKMAKALGKGK